MKIKELVEKDNKSLLKLLDEAKVKLLKDRFKIASREATNVSEISKSRRLVARIETILREREIIETEKKSDTKVLGEKK